jgi:hypothetical protein
MEDFLRDQNCRSAASSVCYKLVAGTDDRGAIFACVFTGAR